MISDLESEIEIYTACATGLDVAIADLRSRISNSHTSPRELSDMDTKASVAEGRLHELITRFNQMLSLNDTMKTEIDLLRREKDMFHSIEEKMSRELKRLTGQLSSIAQKSKADYAARDVAHTRIADLKALADREHAEFEKEWNELARLMESDKRMREFLEQKELQTRSTKIQKETGPVPDSSRGECQDEIDQLKTQLQKLQNQFEYIKQATGFGSAEDLFKFFVKKEQMNFSMKQNISDNLRNASKTTDSIKSVRGQIELLTGSRDTSMIESDRSLRNKLETRIDELNTKHSHMHKLLTSLRSITRSILSKTFKDDQSLLERHLSACVFASSATVPLFTITDDNVLHYLTAIERRTEELLRHYLFLLPVSKKSPVGGSKAGYRKSVAGFGLKQVHGLSNMSSVLAKISQYKLPSAVEEDAFDLEHDNDNDESLRPLSMSELQARTLEHIRWTQERSKMKKTNMIKIK